MTVGAIARAYAAGILTVLALDLLWLGVVAKGFYAREMGHLMAANIRWVPGLLFYAIYLAAVLVLVVHPAVERGSLARAAITGAVLGLAAYSAFDLTGLALLKDFPVRAAVVDLAWGTGLTTVVSVVGYLVAVRQG